MEIIFETLRPTELQVRPVGAFICEEIRERERTRKLPKKYLRYTLYLGLQTMGCRPNPVRHLLLQK